MTWYNLVVRLFKNRYIVAFFIVLIFILFILSTKINKIISQSENSQLAASITSSDGYKKVLFVFIEGASGNSEDDNQADWFITHAETKIDNYFGSGLSDLYEVIKIRVPKTHLIWSYVEENGDQLVQSISDYFNDESRDPANYSIIIAGHSAGAVALWNYKDELPVSGDNVGFVYFDSPYNVCNSTVGACISDLIGFDDLANIHLAKDEGIAGHDDHYDWSNGLTTVGDPRHVKFRTDDTALQPIIDKFHEIHDPIYLERSEDNNISDCNESIEDAFYSYIDEELTLICNSVEHKFCPIDWDMWIDFTISSSMIQYYEDNLEGLYECY